MAFVNQPGRFQHQQPPGYFQHQQPPGHFQHQQPPGHFQQQQPPGHFQQQQPPGHFEQKLPATFQTGVMDCCSDISVCFCGACCLTCLGCSIADDMGECCLCGLGMPIRAVYRTKYNIPGSLCNDYLMSLCCLPCVTCQLKRDINLRKEQGIF